MKKIKYFLMGFLVAALLFGSIGIFADTDKLEYIFHKSDCKLIINDKEYSNPDIPVYLYTKDDRNYAPIAVVRDLCLKLGVEFNYDNKAKEIKIVTKDAPVVVIPTPTIVPEPIVTPEPTPADPNVEARIGQTPDGIQVDYYKGKNYVPITYVKDKYADKGIKTKHESMNLSGGITKYQIFIGDKLILDEIPTIHLYGAFSVEYNYYINTIMPVLQQE